MPKYEIPHARELFNHYRKGLPFWENHLQRLLKAGRVPRQVLVPEDPALARKLGLSPGERVFFFAGGYGDWAAPLARTTQVHYTDATRSIVDYVRRKHAGSGIQSFSVRDAMLWPQKPEHYHWSASFEPMPVHDFLEFVGVRALLNRKGLVLAYTEKSSAPNWRAAHSTLERVANLYGARVDAQSVRVDSHSRAGPEGFPVMVLKLHTNDEARRKARLDLALLHALQKKPRTTLEEILSLRSVRALESTAPDVRASLDRLHALGRLQAPSMRRTLEVSEPEEARRAAARA